ncbi:MAG: T9SS type A sorting domain-containing protein, partial [Ignavibacteriales bacterium]|nr:T9SS type A sorting domain-containing protein [Ignavibacteriales bacterium]
VEQNTVTASGQWYYSNGIEYSFSHWTSGGQTYSSTITATEHKSFNAVYIGKPSNSVEQVHFGTIVNQPIEIYWNDNLNSNVTQYQIWRKVKHNGVMGNPVLLATVSRGVGTYTDYDYTLTSTYSHDLLLYDVRAYYSVDNTYSDEEWNSVYGQMNAEMKDTKQKVASEKELPTSYSISNYPNPFNPETVINYQLPESGFVTLKVYDILGKEIATLVNEYKEAGFYNYQFAISNYKLTSGIYIYTLNVNGITQSKKMILAK